MALSRTAWIFIGLAVLAAAGGAVVTLSGPRGVRNNNPLNIREAVNGGDKWKGERASDDDPEFEEFNTPEDGYRASAIIMRKYFYTYGLRTIAGMIGRWAPSSENDTAGYIKAVIGRLSKRGVMIPADFDMVPEQFEAMLPYLLDAMTVQEQGSQPWTLAQINAGISQA